MGWAEATGALGTADGTETAAAVVALADGRPDVLADGPVGRARLSINPAADNPQPGFFLTVTILEAVFDL